jgi:hypothetical protein
MARARNIKPGFFKNEDLGTADPFVSLLFAGLWTLADKSGILEDRPLRIKAELFPYRDGFDINGYLTVIEQFGLIHRYEVDGVKYIQVAKFKEHQNPHHTEKDSIYPSYSDSCKLTVKEPLNNGITPADSLIPDSLIPDSLNTDSLIPDSFPVPADKSAGSEKQDTELQIACKETWASYSQAFFTRYGTDPVRNATVNSQVKQFVRRLGFSESPQVASWFLEHTDSFYIRGGHTFGMLAKDAEKLRTEWATGRRMNGTKARQVERSGSMVDAVNEILSERNAA